MRWEPFLPSQVAAAPVKHQCRGYARPGRCALTRRWAGFFGCAIPAHVRVPRVAVGSRVEATSFTTRSARERRRWSVALTGAASRRISTNWASSEGIENVLEALSKQVAELTSIEEDELLVEMRVGVPICFGGRSHEYAAHCLWAFGGYGDNKQNRDLHEAVCKVLTRYLGIAPERVRITRGSSRCTWRFAGSRWYSHACARSATV